MSKYRIVTGLIGCCVVYYVEKQEKRVVYKNIYLKTYDTIDVWMPVKKCRSNSEAYELSLEQAEAVVKRLLKREQFKSEVVGEYDLSYIRRGDADTQKVQAEG